MISKAELQAERSVVRWTALYLDRVEAVQNPQNRVGGEACLSQYIQDRDRYERLADAARERLQRCRAARERREQRERFWHNCCDAAP